MFCFCSVLSTFSFRLAPEPPPNILVEDQKEKIIVSTNEYKGHQYIDLRVHYEDETSGDYKPTKKGIAVNPKILPDVVEMMVQAAESLQ